MLLTSVAAEAEVLPVSREDTSQTTSLHILVIVALQASLALAIWAFLAPSKVREPEGKAPVKGESKDASDNDDSTCAPPTDSGSELCTTPTDAGSGTETARSPKVELPRPWSVYQEKQMRMDPTCCFGIDVECAAIGWRHQDRYPCRVAVVAWNGATVLDVAVWVPNLVSPLTAVTGMYRRNIEHGMPLGQVRDLIQSRCGPRAILVGQSVEHDLSWLNLRRGVDYCSHIDLAQVFACAPQGSDRPRILCLEHVAAGLLNVQIQSSAHSPIEDASVALKLLLSHGSSHERVDAARARLAQLYSARRFRPRQRPPALIDGVCMGGWSKFCSCNSLPQPSVRTVRS
jgi:hypothetical protein